MRKQILSIAAILLSTALFLMGNGLMTTLIPVRAHLAHFANLSIGFVGSAYYAGFVTGCFAGPRLLARVGHIRTFAVAAGVAAAATLAQGLLVNEIAWILTRGLFGFAAANLYMVIESWLNDRADNATRGRIFASYLTVNFGGLIVGQWFYTVGRPESGTLFMLAAMFYAVCLIPVGLTKLPQPAPAEVPELRPLKLFQVAPVGVAGCIAVGFANASVWTFLPVYGQSIGLHRSLLAALMIAFTLGGTLIQVPLGRLSDRMDRRYVIAGISLAACLAGIAMFLFGHKSTQWTLILAATFGVMTLPLYGLSVAHANDRLPRDKFVEASATLLMINAVASVFGPPIAALVTARAGMSALFLFTAAVHLLLLVFTLARIGVKESPPEETREPYAPVPQNASPAVLELDPRGPESGEPASA